MGCSLLGFSIHEIFQARILEWVAIPSLGDLPNPGIDPCLLRLMHWQANSLPTEPLGKPRFIYLSVYIGEGNGTPLQYSCLENLMDGEAWWATVHGVAKSRT